MDYFEYKQYLVVLILFLIKCTNIIFRFVYLFVLRNPVRLSKLNKKRLSSLKNNAVKSIIKRAKRLVQYKIEFT